MMGLALGCRELSQGLIDRYGLQDRCIFRREGADREFRFLYRDKQPVIPAWLHGELGVFTWGGGQTRLPRTPWVAIEHLEKWKELAPAEIEIPATYGFDRGIWFLIREGVKGVYVLDEREQPHVYLLTKPATHYYQVMTRNHRMPILVGQSI